MPLKVAILGFGTFGQAQNTKKVSRPTFFCIRQAARLPHSPHARFFSHSPHALLKKKSLTAHFLFHLSSRPFAPLPTRPFFFPVPTRPFEKKKSHGPCFFPFVKPPIFPNSPHALFLPPLPTRPLFCPETPKSLTAHFFFHLSSRPFFPNSPHALFLPPLPTRPFFPPTPHTPCIPPHSPLPTRCDPPANSFGKKQKNGVFSQFLAKRWLQRGHSVLAYSRSDYREIAEAMGAQYFNDTGRAPPPSHP